MVKRMNEEVIKEDKFELVSDFNLVGDQIKAVSDLENGIKSNSKNLLLKGVTGSGKTFVVANLINRVQMPTLIISHNKTLASQLYRELKQLFPKNKVEFFISFYDFYQPETYIPSKDLFIKKDFIINEEIERMRQSALISLLENKCVIVISTVSCLYQISGPVVFKSFSIKIVVGQYFDRQKLILKLINQNYQRTEDIPTRGTFRLIGDNIEIYPVSSYKIYRIESEWEEIIKIKEVEPDTYTIEKELDKLTIYPAGSVLLTPQNKQKAIYSISEELASQVKKLKSIGRRKEANRLKSRTEQDMELIMYTGTCPGIENYLYHLNLVGETKQGTLIDYFTDYFLTIIDESHVTIPQIKGMHKSNESRKKQLIENGFRLPSILFNKPLSYQEFEKKVDYTLYASATPDNFEIAKSSIYTEMLTRPTGILNPRILIKSKKNQKKIIIDELKSRVQKNERSIILTLTKVEAEILTDELIQTGFSACYIHSETETTERVVLLNKFRKGDIQTIIGVNILREGLDLPEASLMIILDADKNGFMRTNTSLMQMVGRVSRHENGTVIMFADTITKSIKQTIQENNRQRKMQEEYNKQEGITPKSIITPIIDIHKNQSSIKDKIDSTLYKDIVKNYDVNNKDNREIMIKELTALFEYYALNLEFDKAESIRQKIETFKHM